MSTTDRPLPDLVPLARFGTVTYAHLEGVFAIHEDGQLLFHCTDKAWPMTPEARASSLDATIAEAEAKLAQLREQRQGLQPALPVLPAPKPLAEEPKKQAREREKLRCRLCGRLIASGFFPKHLSAYHPETLTPEAISAREVGAPSPQMHPDEPWPPPAFPEPMIGVPAEVPAGN